MHGADLGVGSSGDALRADALVDDGGVVDGVIIDDGRVVVDFCHLGWRQTIMREIVLVKILYRDKCEVLRMESEFEANSHGNAVETPA